MPQNTKVLLKEAKKGFNSLNLPNKYQESALENLEKWLTKPDFKEYAPQIIYLIESKKWEFLLDAFYKVISFGTGGRRGLVGIGPNRINVWTIQSSAQGHSQYLVKKYGNTAKTRGVVLTYDVRKYTQKGIYNDKIANPVMDLDCKDLAIAAAKVYAANGIKVYFFESVRSTPELSFAIRYLKAIGGDMFSASHNAPTDNGKKVYDEFGGQLIPPHDQELVNEVTKNVSAIKIVNFDQAREKKLIEIIGSDVDEAYLKTVLALSLSKERNVKIAYSPLHGTGLTSIYHILKRAGFNVELDPKTSNLSGAFENVTFNIPNPEVTQSFDKSLEFAKSENADILLSSDPDADRIGVMVNHKNSWQYLNGNEIGIILTEFAISKFKEQKKLNKNSTIIKTDVTTSLVARIAEENHVHCIGNLLVGFKYIGEEMNKLEAEGKMGDFIIGTEESHGFIMGNYVRDKDAASAALWLSELAAELKKQGKTLLDYLNEIYSRYGYCNNYLTEIRLLGATGLERINKIQDYLRTHTVKSFGDFQVAEKIDRSKGAHHVSETDTASRNVLTFKFKNLPETQNMRVTIRPSGTEPKIKMYYEVLGHPFNLAQIAEEKKKISEIKDNLEKAFMKYCYKILGIDFPDRGFLLFWQLPVDDKMRYFEIEPKIAKLKNISNKNQRKDQLTELLKFLGANPIEKINDAFRAKYKQDLIKYLDI